MIQKSTIIISFILGVIGIHALFQGMDFLGHEHLMLFSIFIYFMFLYLGLVRKIKQ